jgi:hypothetical protein
VALAYRVVTVSDAIDLGPYLRGPIAVVVVLSRGPGYRLDADALVALAREVEEWRREDLDAFAKLGVGYD